MTSQQTDTPANPLRILVVDDEQCIRHILGSFLRQDGHEVGVACDGREALEKFEAGTWDVVITDRAMPRMGGEELAAEIKERAPGVPVILVTGLRTGLNQPPGSGSPIDVVVEKPFTSAALRTAIASAMDAAGQTHVSAVDDSDLRAA